MLGLQSRLYILNLANLSFQSSVLSIFMLCLHEVPFQVQTIVVKFLERDKAKLDKYNYHIC